METNSQSQVNLVKLRTFFAAAKREEIKNVRINRYDDKEMVKRLTNGLLKLANEEEVDEE